MLAAIYFDNQLKKMADSSRLMDKKNENMAAKISENQEYVWPVQQSFADLY